NARHVRLVQWLAVAARIWTLGSARANCAGTNGLRNVGRSFKRIVRKARRALGEDAQTLCTPRIAWPTTHPWAPLVIARGSHAQDHQLGRSVMKLQAPSDLTLLLAPGHPARVSPDFIKLVHTEALSPWSSAATGRRSAHAGAS